MKKNTAILFVLFILFSLALFCRDTSPEVAGIWTGRLEVQGTSLTLVVHIERDSQGNLTGAIDSPDQGAFGIPITSASLQGVELIFTVDSIGGRYQGALNPEVQTITGNWNQGGLALPLSLEKTKEAPGRSPRPQEPSRPYPYLEEEVRYPNPSAGIHLAGCQPAYKFTHYIGVYFYALKEKNI